MIIAELDASSRKTAYHISSGCKRIHSQQLVCALALFLTVTFASTPIVLSEDNSESIAPSPSNPSPENEEEPIEQFGLWPLLSIDETPTWRQFSLRPFYVERASKDGAEKKVQILWPIYLYRRYEQDVTIRLFPLFAYRKDVYAYNGSLEHDMDYMLLPVLFGGESTEAGRYFAVFPIAGNLKDFLGRDNIHFFLFPLYLDYTKDELRQKNYLWPVLSFSSGDGYDGFRIWPLFGYFEKEDEYRNEFFLWPIVHHQLFDLDKEESGERLLIFPLYAREDSRRRSYRAILWPFFTHEENYAGNFEQYTAPWPFIVIARGDIYRTQVWPFYGYKETEDATSRFLFWPFWYQRVFEAGEDSKIYETRLIPFMAKKTEISESQGLVRHNSKFWPLWRFRRAQDGSTNLRMLSLLWFDDEEGFERHYAPFWTIYEHGTKPDGTSQTYALWRLYRHSHTATGSETRIPLVFASEEDTIEETQQTKLFGGLLGKKREGAERSVQIFFFIHIPY